jgi:hypothetical protein
LFLNTVTLEDVCAGRVLGSSGVIHAAQRGEGNPQATAAAE